MQLTEKQAANAYRLVQAETILEIFQFDKRRDANLHGGTDGVGRHVKGQSALARHRGLVVKSYLYVGPDSDGEPTWTFELTTDGRGQQLSDEVAAFKEKVKQRLTRKLPTFEPVAPDNIPY
jgi:hypothetical protein